MDRIHIQTGEIDKIVDVSCTERSIERNRMAWEAENPIAEFPKTISRLAGEYLLPTRDEIATGLAKLRKCKSLKTGDAWDLLASKVTDTGMTFGRFSVAVDYLITKHKGSTFQFADLLEYDEQIPVYKIADLRDRATNSQLIGKTFCQIRYDGWRGVWVEKRYAEDFRSKIYGEITVEAKEKKIEDNRESEFLNTVPVNGLRNSMIFVERFNLRHKTSFASFRELFEWYMALPSDFIRDNRLDEPLFPENKHENFIQ